MSITKTLSSRVLVTTFNLLILQPHINHPTHHKYSSSIIITKLQKPPPMPQHDKHPPALSHRVAVISSLLHIPCKRQSMPCLSTTIPMAPSASHILPSRGMKSVLPQRWLRCSWSKQNNEVDPNAMFREQEIRVSEISRKAGVLAGGRPLHSGLCVCLSWISKRFKDFSQCCRIPDSSAWFIQVRE